MNDSNVEVDPHEQAAKDKGKAAMKKMIKWRNGEQTPWQKRTTSFLKDIPAPPAKHFMGTWYNAGCLLMNNVTKCGKPPSGRGGHTATRVGNRVFVFGGCYLDYGCFNDMYTLEGTNMTWTKVAATGQVPIPRMGHTATRVGHQILVFGGSTEDGALDDMYIFNTDTNSWLKPAVSGNAPSAREEHSAVRANNKIFFYGGLAPDGTILGDLHVFDAEFNLWFNNPPMTGQLPTPRSGHSAVMYENRMFVFGGHSTDGTLNELRILDTQLMSWFSPTVSGTIPKPRQDHAAVMVGYKMIVYGGCSYPDRVCNNDAVGLNVVTGKWAPLDSLGSTPSAREGHTLERLDQNRVVMIGGCKLDSGCFHDVHIMENTTNRCPRDCLKRGKCKRDEKSRSSCECAIGYSGVYCRKIVPCPNNCSSDGATPRGQCGTTKKNALFHACKCEPGWGGLDCSKVKVASQGSGKKSGSGSGSSSGGAAGGASGSGSAAAASGSTSSAVSGSTSGSALAAGSSAASGSASTSAAASGSGSAAASDSATGSSATPAPAGSASGSGSAASPAPAPVPAPGGGSASIFSATSKSTAAAVPSAGGLQSTFRKLRGALIDPHEFVDAAEEGAKAALVTPEEAEKSESDSDSDSASESASGSGSGSTAPAPPPPAATKKTKCPGDCNMHGKCKGTKCYCEAGFTTDDCSVTVEDYEKGVDPAALVEKDLIGMFVACFIGGCAFVGVIQCGTYCWGRMKKKWRNEPDSDSDE